MANIEHINRGGTFMNDKLYAPKAEAALLAAETPMKVRRYILDLYNGAVHDVENAERKLTEAQKEERRARERLAACQADTKIMEERLALTVEYVAHQRAKDLDENPPPPPEFCSHVWQEDDKGRTYCEICLADGDA